MRSSLSTTHLLLCLASLISLSLQTSMTDNIIRYESGSLTSHDLVRLKRQSGPDTRLGETTTTSKPFVHPEDETEYYTVQYHSPSLGGRSFWKNLTNAAVKHASLQDNYRLAVKIKLNFNFQFYGHMVNHVTIATGGFLYMSDFLHAFLTASQYIAPLMANFDTSLGRNESEILYEETDEAFIVQWNNVYLRDKVYLGKYTFQVQLYKQDGRIVAAYKDIPSPIANITGGQHPVKVGLSDAFYWDVGQYRTIFPYHTYNATLEKVESGSAIVFTHKTTCNLLTNCNDCMHSDLLFTCYWCSKIGQCSNSFDRQRQLWVTTGCVHNTTQTHCDQMFTTTQPPIADGVQRGDLYLSDASTTEPQAWKAITAAICTVFGLSAAVILGIILYGYRNPQSNIGQFLVRNRPSELWRKFKTWKDKKEETTNNMSQI